MAFLKLFPPLSLAVLAGSMPLIAVSQANTVDSLKAVVAEQRALMVQADSNGQLQTAFEARVHLASLERKTEALALLKQAAALADSLDRPDLGTMARRLLAGRYASSGSYAAAYSEALSADSLRALYDEREADRWQDEQAMQLHRSAARQDSLLQAASQRERGMAQAIVDLQRRSDGWMYGAIAALLVGLLLVIGLLYRLGKVEKKRRAAVEDLRLERAKPRNAITGGTRRISKDEAVCTFPAPVTATAPEHPVDEAMEPVASGMFRKEGPERLSTLIDARKRGDDAKVLRVVATLRPQLLAFDAERYGPLIARLKAPDATADTERWNADLDTLEDAIKRLLARKGGH